MAYFAGLCSISGRSFNGAWGRVPFSSDREQKDSLHHPVSKETLWKYFIRELHLDRIMEGNTQITLLLNLWFTEHLWCASNKLAALNHHLGIQGC